MKKLSIQILIFFLMSSFTGNAQKTDFGTWLGLNFNTNLAKRLSADLDLELRMFDTLSRVDEALIEGGVKYNIIKHVDLVGSYRYSRTYDLDYGYFNEHRLIIGTLFWIKPGRFKISLQEKLQFAFKNIYQGGVNIVETRFLRSKVSVNYNWPKSKINPFTSLEIYYDFSQYNDHEFDKLRCKVGVEYAINKKIDIASYMQYQTQLNAKTNDKAFIIGLTFSYKLPSIKSEKVAISED